ncbi:MAG: 4Fe-4S binding protein [Kiritimatiellae bacterium]|jgi:ferredoxin|nr:4Fe-4S binding protein [Kiritimatiellia bacterium]MBR4613808.1 4Fe-4S binding protein [Kiritimatiellia bacterium]
MAHCISDDCVKCGACKEACPVAAISEGDTKFVVDEGLCVDCGACEGACPTAAIQPK